MKYNLGTTQIQNNGDTWVYPQNIFVNEAGTWTPVQTGWVCKSDGTWERIWPIPKGVLSTLSSLDYTIYQKFRTAVITIPLSNVGDYDLDIQEVLYLDSDGNYSTVTVGPAFTETVLAPGESTDLTVQIYGVSVGNFSGTIQINSNIGYLGNSSTSIPVTVSVLQDYAKMYSPQSSMTFNIYQYDASTSFAQSAPGTYSYTVPNSVSSIGVTINGGGGGGGGTDSHGGYPGYPGHQLYGTLSVSSGDTLVYHVGGGGGPGANATEGGFATGGYSDAGFSGGTGGPSGYSGTSGAGGGGGAATALYQNSNLIAVAAGGGGGGGGGNYSYGQGQEGFASSGSDAGGAGGNRGGSDGGGPGGGGGGDPGGAAGDIVGGDNGSYSGRDGQDLVPSGWGTASADNGGSPNSSAGGSGSFTMIEYGLATDDTQALTLQNIGMGGELDISSVVSLNGYLSFVLNSNSLSYNFLTYTGTSEVMQVTPYTLPFLGTYQDQIIIESNSITGNYVIPVTINVIQPPPGVMAFESAGTYTFKVPSNVYRLNALVVGGGAGGGAGFTNYGGGGGGGGSGGYAEYQNIAVIPGETLTVVVGNGGFNSRGGQVTVFPVSLSYAWSSFMNTYAVWTNSDGVNPVGQWVSFTRLWYASINGTYTVNVSADNHSTVYIDGSSVGASNDYTTTSSYTINLNAGSHTVLVNGLNDGGPAGVAVTIVDPNNNIVWTTRTLLDPNTGGPGDSTTISGSFGTISIGGGNAGGSATSTPPAIYAGGVGGGDGGGGGGCFLTTATVQALGLPDDCEELQLARKLRDGMLSDSKDKKVVELYYKVAPTITERKTNWIDFYQNAIEPITGLVKLGRYTDAIKVYKYETVKLINEYITYNDREIVEAIFEAGFTKTDLPYAVKYACMKAYFAIKLPIAKWKINHGILRR